MRGGQRDGGGGYVQPRVAWRGGASGDRWDGCAPPSPPLQSHSHSPGGKLFLSGSQGPSLPPTPLLLTLLPSHFLHPTPHAHLGGVPCSPEEGAVETPPQGSPHQPLCSCSLFRPPWPGPRPGAQTWTLRLAAVLSKVVFRPSDLQVLFYVALGELGAPSTCGHPWFPSPTWPCCLGPSSWHKHYQDL